MKQIILLHNIKIFYFILNILDDQFSMKFIRKNEIVLELFMITK